MMINIIQERQYTEPEGHVQQILVWNQTLAPQTSHLIHVAFLNLKADLKELLDEWGNVFTFSPGKS